MNQFPQVSCVLFDMDGLLLDTEPFYTQVTQQIVGRFGKTFNWAIKSQMIGKKSSVSANILVDALELPISPDDYLRERESLLAELFPTAQPLPGAQALSTHLYQHQIAHAVATSSSKSMFDLKTSKHQEWFAQFGAIVTADDVTNGKPAPDIFLKAAKRLGKNPEECVVFEDAPSGMEAALNAGMSVVVVPDVNMDKSVYSRANQILESLVDFKPEAWGLPAFE